MLGISVAEPSGRAYNLAMDLSSVERIPHCWEVKNVRTS
jgi:hypothetical protein